MNYEWVLIIILSKKKKKFKANFALTVIGDPVGVVCGGERKLKEKMYKPVRPGNETRNIKKIWKNEN